jgi:hypothetical protein
MSSFGFLKLLKEAEIMPQTISVEMVEEIMPKIVKKF